MTTLLQSRQDHQTRIRNLRNDLLDAVYGLCIAKASLLTSYLEKVYHPSWLYRLLHRIHYRMYQRGIRASVAEKYQSPLQTAANRLMLRYYRRQERLDYGRILRMYAEGFRYILENMPLKVYRDELIVGNLSSYRIGAPIHPDFGGLMLLPELDSIDRRKTNPMAIREEDRQSLKKRIFPFWFHRSVLANMNLFASNSEVFNMMLNGGYFVLTQFSGIAHLTPDYPSVLRNGFSGILRDIQGKLRETKRELSAAGPERAPELKKKAAYYESAEIVCSAAIAFGRRWRAFLERKANAEQDIERKRELAKLADVFARVPEYPARNFHQALQSIMIVHSMIHYESFQHGVSFGRLDQYLYPYYKKDIEDGTMTEEQAVEYLACFIAKAAELLPLFFDKATEYFSGLSSASGITVGGVLEDGSDAVNELSFLILKAYDQVRLRQPNFHLRYHFGISRDFLELGFEMLKKGGGMPAIFNDMEIIEALSNHHIRISDARNYSIVGCSEWGSPYNSFPAAGAVFVNLAAAYPLAFDPLRKRDRRFRKYFGEPVPPESVTDMDMVKEIIREKIVRLVDLSVDGNNAIERAHAEYRPTPFLSVIVNGTVEKGMDVNAGGARYNTTGCQGVGLADLADSLAAMDILVFRDRRFSLKQFVEIVRNNFEAHMDLRNEIVNKLPKYGENHELSDSYARWISEVFCSEVRRRKNPRGGFYSPGFWTMTTHQGFGRRTGALPNGRLRGQTLSNGVSPQNGWDKKGPTAVFQSASNLASSFISNGYVLNQKMHPDFVHGAKGNAILEGLLRGYFSNGGMQVQFNVIDPEVLIDAKRNPDKHRDLVVRISGYSAYFNDLTESMKDELIARTMHGCCA